MCIRSAGERRPVLCFEFAHGRRSLRGIRVCRIRRSERAARIGGHGPQRVAGSALWQPTTCGRPLFLFCTCAHVIVATHRCFKWIANGSATDRLDSL